MFKRLFFAILITFITISFLTPGTAEARRRHHKKKLSPIPAELEKQIKNEFGEFRLVTERDYCPELKKHVKELLPGMRWGYGDIADDFNGDGNVDYSVIVKIEEEDRFLWLMAVRKYTMGEPFLLTNLGWPSIAHFMFSSKMLSGKLCEGVLVSGQAHTLTADNPYPYLGIAAPPTGIILYKKDGHFYQTGYRPSYITHLVEWKY